MAFGRAHINGDVVVYFPADKALAAGDMFTFGNDVPELIDYSGGGSGKEWTQTLDSALQLDFDTVVPGHGPVTNKKEMAKFRDSTPALRNRVHEMLGQKKHRPEIAKMLQTEFQLGAVAHRHRPRRRNGRNAIKQRYVKQAPGSAFRRIAAFAGASFLRRRIRCG